MLQSPPARGASRELRTDRRVRADLADALSSSPLDFRLTVFRRTAGLWPKDEARLEVPPREKPARRFTGNIIPAEKFSDNDHDKYGTG
jgi:hypothetical protein